MLYGGLVMGVTGCYMGVELHGIVIARWGELCIPLNYTRHIHSTHTHYMYKPRIHTTHTHIHTTHIHLPPYTPPHLYRYRFSQLGVETSLSKVGFESRYTYVGGNTMTTTAFLMVCVMCTRCVVCIKCVMCTGCVICAGCVMCTGCVCSGCDIVCV